MILAEMLSIGDPHRVLGRSLRLYSCRGEQRTRLEKQQLGEDSNFFLPGLTEWVCMHYLRLYDEIRLSNSPGPCLVEIQYIYIYV